MGEIFQYMEASGPHDHPNPERVGCPAEEILEVFAEDPRAFSIRDPIFLHLTRCSPCFQFIEARRPKHA